MFKKILIANRGEIACRVIKTARRLGVQTVAVYSDADANAQHVKLADEAYRIGAPAASESYLLMDKIVDICKLSGAEAVHPGYGFLSENPDFVEVLNKNGITFIGPSADAIRAMGLKDAAKDLMLKADVPVVPGYQGDNQDVGFLAGEAEKIGYPVLIKARAGGGGKGMRRVDRAEDFKEALEGAQREGQASFGDGHCLIEKYIEKPRHIEIQVFGDNHGNCVYLFERDCSLQRRHQKVIEEAPAPGMSFGMRKAMGEAAVRAAQSVNYSGAGTVEFIVDVSEGLQADRFYFMEMNTRLQVEHPVSELISGHDLVEWQLRVASGEELPAQQNDLTINGWAFEARVYAEDVDKGFLPATGTLHHLRLPEETDGVRIDSGVVEGDEISPWYDPMIAKVIAHGPTREAALNRITAALEDSHIWGCVTNTAFLVRLCEHEEFRKGNVETGFIEQYMDALAPESGLHINAAAFAAIGALDIGGASTSPEPWESLTGWRQWGGEAVALDLTYNGEAVDARVTLHDHEHFDVRFGSDHASVVIQERSGSKVTLKIDERVFSGAVYTHDRTTVVFIDGQSFVLEAPDRLSVSDDGGSADGKLTAPMPGLIKVVNVKAGDTVSKGDTLVVMEAMKIEHSLAASADGVVEDVLVAEADQVEDGTVLLIMES